MRRWLPAILLTLLALAYQRTVGPTRPVRGHVQVGATEVGYRFQRSYGEAGDYLVALDPKNPDLAGTLVYRRYKTQDAWTAVPMERNGSRLTAPVPHQPPAGKVAFAVFLHPVDKVPLGARTGIVSAPGDSPDVMAPAGSIRVPSAGPVVVRFRGHVPIPILVPHIVMMFFGMLFSNRAGFEALQGGPRVRTLSLWALAFLVFGGLVLGPVVQWCSFGKAWTGVPFGWDLTDNKTLIAVVGWVLAILACRRATTGSTGSRKLSPRLLTLGAALLTLVVFSIPHSVIGSELDYSKLPAPPTAVPR
jgi:hypothetical protein